MNFEAERRDGLADLTPPRQRRRLCEVSGKWHCMILGSCLSMQELKSIAAKTNVRFTKPDASDYEIHASMVQLASTDRTVAKAMHKALDRKFHLAVKRLSKAGSSQEVADLWHAAIERGEVAGALWALMTHPLANEDLQSKVFGEMHMLSHQVGSEARLGLRHMHALEREKIGLEARLSSLQERFDRQGSVHEKAIHALRQRLEQAQAANKRLSQACEAVEKLPSLQNMIKSLQGQLELTDLRLRLAEQRSETAEAQSRQYARNHGLLEREVATLKQENQALESRLLESLGPMGGAGCALDCGRPDLCGRCILYVGGRTAQMPHLKRLVEECNGTLVHHDGGLEESVGRLDGLLGKADAVMFPIDCISHMAHDKLKSLCKRWEKPFVPVRCSGLGAFMQALETMGKGDGALLS